jgi:hypothetical protein
MNSSYTEVLFISSIISIILTVILLFLSYYRIVFQNKSPFDNYSIYQIGNSLLLLALVLIIASGISFLIHIK